MKERVKIKATSKAKKIIHHLPQAGWCPPSVWKIAALEARPPGPFFLYPIFFSTLSTASYGTEHPFGQFRLAVLAVSPLHVLLCQSRKKRKPQHEASTAQKWTKHCLVINTLLVTNPVCNTLQASVKKKAIPSQPNPAQVNSPQTDFFWNRCYSCSVSCTCHVTLCRPFHDSQNTSSMTSMKKMLRN